MMSPIFLLEIREIQGTISHKKFKANSTLNTFWSPKAKHFVAQPQCAQMIIVFGHTSQIHQLNFQESLYLENTTRSKIE